MFLRGKGVDTSMHTVFNLKLEQAMKNLACGDLTCTEEEISY